VELPTYRCHSCRAQGDFVNVAWKATGVEIPRSAVPLQEAVDQLFNLEMRGGVAEYEDLLATGENAFQSPWPSEIAPLLSDRVLERMSCLRAWRVVPRNTIAGFLDTVRNRVLNFALELEQESGDADKSSAAEIAPPPERVATMVTQNFYGGHHSVAAGTQHVTQGGHIEIVLGSVDSLLEALKQLGLAGTELDCFGRRSWRMALPAKRERRPAPVRKGG
jgi:hypothetical protein